MSMFLRSKAHRHTLACIHREVVHSLIITSLHGLPNFLKNPVGSSKGRRVKGSRRGGGGVGACLFASIIMSLHGMPSLCALNLRHFLLNLDHCQTSLNIPLYNADGEI